MTDDGGIKTIDGGRATTIVRSFLEENYGNLGMLLYRIEDVQQNGTKDKFIVLCSLLTSLGSSKRIYYQIKVNISDGNIVEIWQGEEDKTSGKIVLRKREISGE